MRKLFTLVILGFLSNTYSQSPLLWSEDYKVDLTYYYSDSPRIISENENSFKVVGRKNTTNGQRLSMVEYDLEGNVLSEQTFGNDLVSNNRIVNYKFDSSNYLYIINHEPVNINKSKVVLQKYSLDGNLIWVEQLQDSGIHSYEPLSLSISENGTIFLTAQKYIFDYDFYYDFSNRLYAYDSEGNQLWERIFDELNELEWVSEKNFVYDNEIYLIGKDLLNTNQLFNFKLLKIDTDNNITLNTTVLLNNGFQHFHITQDNKLLITASAKYRISKMNLDGSLLWSEYYQENPPINPYSEGIKSSIQDEDGNIYITGGYWKYNNDNPNSTRSDILTLKFDSSGNLLWQNLYQYEGNKTDVGNVIVLKNGYIYVGGHSQNEAVTGYDYVVLKLDAEAGISNGVYRYNGLADGTDSVTSLYVFDDGKVALTGLSHNGTTYDWTTQLLSDVTLSVENVSLENNIKIYPNPTEQRGLLYVSGNNLKDYSVFSLTGQIIKQGKFDSEDVHTIAVEDLTQGVYLIRLNIDTGTETRKIIIR